MYNTRTTTVLPQVTTVLRFGFNIRAFIGVCVWQCMLLHCVFLSLSISFFFVEHFVCSIWFDTNMRCKICFYSTIFIIVIEIIESNGKLSENFWISVLPMSIGHFNFLYYIYVHSEPFNGYCWIFIWKFPLATWLIVAANIHEWWIN